MSFEAESQDHDRRNEQVHYEPAVFEAPGWTWSKRVCMITLSTMLIIVSIAYMLERTFGFPSSVAVKYSNFLGVFALVLSFFQFIPQIYQTYLLQVPCAIEKSKLS